MSHDELLANMRAIEEGRSAPLLDPMGRTPIANGMKAKVAEIFKAVPKGKRGALLVFADDDGNAQAHLAAKLGDSWKVAGGGGFNWKTKRPAGYIGVEGYW
jgi:hypothetical protein